MKYRSSSSKSMSAILWVFLILLICSFHTNSQSITWEKQFHFAYSNWTGSAIETIDSGFFVPSYIGGNGSSAFWLVKLNKYGNFVWKKIIDPYASQTLSIIRKKPGYYLMIDLGAKYDSITKKASDNDNLIEFNDNGDTLWTKNYNSLVDHFSFYGLLSLNGGNYILQSALLGSKNKMLIQKFNSAHQQVWSDTFSFGKQTGGGTIFKTKQNKILVGGAVGKGGINDQFAFLQLLDTSGKKLNYIPFPTNADSSEEIQHIQQLENGNIIVQSADEGRSPVYFTLTDSNGNILKRWTNNNLPNGIGGLVSDGDSVFVFADLSLLSGPLILLKYDTAFNQILNKQYDDTRGYYNVAGQAIRTLDGGMILAGTRSAQDTGTGTGFTTSDMVVIKVDKNGNCPNEDFAGVNNSFLGNQISLFPNPTIDNLYISNPHNISAITRIDIFDSHGTKVFALPLINPGIVKINVYGLSKGLYMYRLYNNAKIYEVGKFMKE